MASYFTQYHIKVRDIVDVLLRHTSRDDDADPLGSMYVDGAFDPDTHAQCAIPSCSTLKLALDREEVAGVRWR